MSSSPNISFMLHDVARLLRQRFEQRSLPSGLRRPQPADRRAWLLYLTPQAHSLLEIMRGKGRKTRDGAFAGLSPETQQHLLQTLSLIKTNLLAACIQPAVDREKVHG